MTAYMSSESSAERWAPLPAVCYARAEAAWHLTYARFALHRSIACQPYSGIKVESTLDTQNTDSLNRALTTNGSLFGNCHISKLLLASRRCFLYARSNMLSGPSQTDKPALRSRWETTLDIRRGRRNTANFSPPCALYLVPHSSHPPLAIFL